jgi:hypothetical protein
MGAIIALSLVALASTPLALTTLAQQGVMLPGAVSATKLMAMLDARSPGEREQGALSTKVKKAAVVAATKPRERALGKVFPAQPAPTTPTQKLATVVAPVTPVAPAPLAPPPTLASVVAPPAGLPGGFILPGIGGIGGIGATPTPPTTTPPPPVETPVPAVPEPGTWMLMLLGFGIAGTAARRGRRSSAALLKAA